MLHRLDVRPARARGRGGQGVTTGRSGYRKGAYRAGPVTAAASDLAACLSSGAWPTRRR
jgi:hypothetical protein